MIKLIRNDEVKFQKNENSLKELKELGWTVDSEKKTEYELLKEKADELGIEYVGNISKADLTALIAEKSA